MCNNIWTRSFLYNTGMNLWLSLITCNVKVTSAELYQCVHSVHASFNDLSLISRSEHFNCLERWNWKVNWYKGYFLQYFVMSHSQSSNFVWLWVLKMIQYIMIEGPIVYNFICNMYTTVTTHNYLVTVRRIGNWEGRGRYSGTRQNP